MPKGDYLTRDPWGQPKDEYEKAAKQWLERSSGTEGHSVMESLGALIRSTVELDRKTRASSE